MEKLCYQRSIQISTLDEVYAEKLAEGQGQTQRTVALSLLRQGVSVEIVADGTGLSIDEVKELLKE